MCNIIGDYYMGFRSMVGSDSYGMTPLKAAI